MLERGHHVTAVPGVLSVVSSSTTNPFAGLPTQWLFSSEIDPSNVALDTNITVHVDVDVLGNGTFTQDVVTSFTLAPGGSVMIKNPFPQGMYSQFRVVTASGKGWMLYDDSFHRFSGVQKG
jgi:hypothetical protein